MNLDYSEVLSGIAKTIEKVAGKPLTQNQQLALAGAVAVHLCLFEFTLNEMTAERDSYRCALDRIATRGYCPDPTAEAQAVLGRPISPDPFATHDVEILKRAWGKVRALPLALAIDYEIYDDVMSHIEFAITGTKERK